MRAKDYPTVASIYQEGIDTGNATFNPAPPASWAEWRRGKINECSLVARQGDLILGWAAVSPTSRRKVYAGVVEVSIYVGSQARGQGTGSRLLQALIESTEGHGIWTLQAGIFPENTASLELHRKHGFRVVGVREKLGWMEFGPYKGEWRDVLLLERRSQVTGVPLV